MVKPVNAIFPLQWRHDNRILSRLFRRKSRKSSKLRVAVLCEENLPLTSGFPSQMAINAENVSIWWRPQDFFVLM